MNNILLKELKEPAIINKITNNKAVVMNNNIKIGRLITN